MEVARWSRPSSDLHWLRGVFGVANLGLGLPGAGVAASWRGFGFVGPEEGSYLPKQTLNEETLNHSKLLGSALDQVLSDFSIAELVEGDLGKSRLTFTLKRHY